MAFSYNGFGTAHLEAGPLTHADGCDHYDAVVAVCALWVPLFPIAAEHIRTPVLLPLRLIAPVVKGAAFPVRLDRRILLKAYLRRIAWFTIAAAAMFVILGAARVVDPPVSKTEHLAPIGIVLAAIAALLFHLVSRMNVRERRIRILLGVHERGMSDPFTWGHLEPWIVKKQTLAESGMPSLEAIVEASMREGEFATAMYHTRLLARTDDRRLGEDLTNRILNAAEWKGGAE